MKNEQRYVGSNLFCASTNELFSKAYRVSEDPRKGGEKAEAMEKRVTKLINFIVSDTSG